MKTYEILLSASYTYEADEDAALYGMTEECSFRHTVKAANPEEAKRKCIKEFEADDYFDIQIESVNEKK